MRPTILVLLTAAFAPSLLAQLTPDQRVHDFQNLVALYQRRYAPIEWKKHAVGFDLLDTKSWLDRVRNAKDDIAYHEIAAEYVASFEDTHSSYRAAPGSYTASLGFWVDIYDGKVLVEQIDRMRLPQSEYPFEIGDELIALDGKSAEEWISELSKYRRWGNRVSTRRSAADRITFRTQSLVPRVVELGDTATVIIRRHSGETNTYIIPWQKTNLPFTGSPAVPMPKVSASRAAAADSVPEWQQYLDTVWNWTGPSDEQLFHGETHDEEGNVQPRRYILGLGSRPPTFALPSNFVQRVGRGPSDFHFSGVYESDGLRIGYLRIPSFSPPNWPAAVQELENEIKFFNENTDGLVVDVTRNPGGGCYMYDAAARLIPYTFWFFGEEVRPTWDRISSAQAALESAKRRNADEWVVVVLSYAVDAMLEAYRSGSLLSMPVPACTSFSGQAPSWESPPAEVNYSKPMIVLIDEFSISAADIFPAMIQDNQRAPLVGMRTSGGGGSVSSWPTGFLTEATASNTNTLVIRRNAVANAPDMPVNRYIENTGVRPDIELDRMTRNNLVNRGQDYVTAFTGIMVDHIRNSH